jgi:hypothetical protein
MGISYVQANYNDSVSPGTTNNVILPGVTKGNLIVVCLTWYNTQGAVGAITSLGDGVNTYTLCPNGYQGGGFTSGGNTEATLNVIFYYAIAISSGSITITGNWNNSVQLPVVIASEWSGANAFDVGNSGANEQTFNYVCSSGNVTTNYPAELLIGASCNNTYAPGTGWNELFGGSIPNTAGAFMYQIVSVKGTYAATVDCFANYPEACAIATFYSTVSNAAPKDVIFFSDMF